MAANFTQRSRYAASFTSVAGFPPTYMHVVCRARSSDPCTLLIVDRRRCVPVGSR